MIELIAKLGISGAIGFLVGLLVIWWVEPVTSDGTILLVAICIILSIIISSFISKKAKSTSRKTDAHKNTKNKIWLPGDD